MTLRLFFHSDDLEAKVEVLDCSPWENESWVELHATLFHPQGGGQPGDTGWIGESQVLRVVQDGQKIIHYVDRPVALGMTSIRIDEQRRTLNSRLHSAGHLIGHFAEARGWTPIKAHHWPGESRVQFKPGENPEDLDASIIQRGIDEWIASDLPRQVRLRDGVREVGFAELAAYGCGGTHVRRLQELGVVTIDSLSQKKGTLSVRYYVD
jgi:Ser-tRNA(Ala) deacylase AlaX